MGRGSRLDDSEGRVCTDCGVFKTRDEFYTTSRDRKDGTRPLMPYCIDCTSERNKKAYSNDPEAHNARVKAWTERQLGEDAEAYRNRLRENRLRREYGISVADWDRLYDEQLGRCAVCLIPLAERRNVVDHDHVTGKVRGILCSQCNVAIGLLGEDAERVARAAQYLLSSEQGRDEDAIEPAHMEGGDATDGH